MFSDKIYEVKHKRNIHCILMQSSIPVKITKKHWGCRPKKAGCAISIRDRVRQQISSLLIVGKKAIVFCGPVV